MCVCAFDGFLLWVRIASACPTIASLCNTIRLEQNVVPLAEGDAQSPQRTLDPRPLSAARRPRRFRSVCVAEHWRPEDSTTRELVIAAGLAQGVLGHHLAKIRRG